MPAAMLYFLERYVEAMSHHFSVPCFSFVERLHRTVLMLMPLNVVEYHRHTTTATYCILVGAQRVLPETHLRSSISGFTTGHPCCLSTTQCGYDAPIVSDAGIVSGVTLMTRLGQTTT